MQALIRQETRYNLSSTGKGLNFMTQYPRRLTVIRPKKMQTSHALRFSTLMNQKTKCAHNCQLRRKGKVDSEWRGMVVTAFERHRSLHVIGTFFFVTSVTQPSHSCCCSRPVMSNMITLGLGLAAAGMIGENRSQPRDCQVTQDLCRAPNAILWCRSFHSPGHQAAL